MSQYKRKPIYPIALLLTAFFAFCASASDGDESLMGFDSIVNRLSQGQTSTRYDDISDPFANILFHSGVGMTTSNISIESLNGGENISGFMKGVEINLGIDLFSRNWIAEGSFRNFATEELKEHTAALKEFDLKLVYKKQFLPNVNFKTGGGLAARYLTFVEIVDGNAVTQEFTTPSSMVFLGMEASLTRALSLGAEISYRATMVDETADQKAFDASLRVDAHF